MHIDLHTHTNFSDGKLSPDALVQRAMANGVEMLSITDHDTVSAYQHFNAANPDITLIPGIEFSTFWNKTGIHIVGLNIDLHSDALLEAIAHQHQARRSRSEAIAERLEKQGIRDALAGAQQIAGNDNVGRPHFARHIVNTGAAESINQAFDKYLDSRSGDIRKFWATLPQIVSWIRDAGGLAVLAHPLKYKLTRTKLVELLDDFIEAGGHGMEVISGKQPEYLASDLAKLCKQKNLLASCGSDFHQPDQSWSDIGRYPPLPKDCTPVWEHF
jgi:predicted metal-dependent phosphoesterase TrpH